MEWKLINHRRRAGERKNMFSKFLCSNLIMIFILIHRTEITESERPNENQISETEGEKVESEEGENDRVQDKGSEVKIAESDANSKKTRSRKTKFKSDI